MPIRHTTPNGETGSSPVRVAIDTTPLIGVRTGIGQLVAGLVAELERRPEVRIRRVAFTWKGRHEAGAQRYPIPARAAHAVWGRSNRGAIEWWSGPVDVVHGTNYVVPPTRRAGRIVSVHDLTAVHFPQLCTPVTRRHPAMVQRAVRAGAWVHCDSQFVAHEVEEWLQVGPERVRVVMPGIPTVGVHSTREVASPLAVGSQAPYILAIGTAEPRKDLPCLVRAFGHLADAHSELRLVHAGPPGWGSAAVDDAVAALEPSVRARVARLGWVDNEERSWLLANASVFAYPSLYEGFGLPPLEAMAQGVPVVATCVGSLPEVLGAACVLVKPGDDVALATAIEGLLTSKADRVSAISAGRAKAATYTWNRMGTEMIALYRDVQCAS